MKQYRKSLWIYYIKIFTKMVNMGGISLCFKYLLEAVVSRR